MPQLLRESSRKVTEFMAEKSLQHSLLDANSIDRYKTRKPNFSLAFSTSGKLLPRKVVHGGNNHHHFRSASVASVQNSSVNVSVENTARNDDSLP